MRHRKHTFKVGRTSEHRESMLGNMACSLFIEGRISTTVPKAKELRRFAEKMISLGKDGTLAARRRAISEMGQPKVVSRLFKDVAPRFAARTGGYTRIIKLGQRIGDGADMCFIELLASDAAPAAEAAPAPAAVEAAPAQA
ncbi:MAG: 50S ribosomal protein L17 [Lentisphaeria bacterium]